MEEQRIRVIATREVRNVRAGDLVEGREGIDWEWVQETPLIEALPGRVILRYGAPVEQKPDSLIIIPETSRRRTEFGRLVHIGEPTTPIEEIQVCAIKRAHAAGRVFPIAMVRGEPFWQLEMGDEYAWLKEYRAFAIGQLFATIPDPEKEQE